MSTSTVWSQEAIVVDPRAGCLHYVDYVAWNAFLGSVNWVYFRSFQTYERSCFDTRFNAPWKKNMCEQQTEIDSAIWQHKKLIGLLK